MSDSVDRVFVHALATVRRLPRTGSSRPPPASRLRLYGLYKQSMEGDVTAILPRPTLPISSPDPNNNNNNSVHRYASRDVRTREAQAEIEKWDAWHACAGMSRTDAKREYISTLIDTMKEYASGTAESRELVGELEFVWSQIRSQSGSGSDPDEHNGSDEKKKSPERRDSDGAGRSQVGSRPSPGSTDPGGGRSNSENMETSAGKQMQQQQQQRPPARPRRTQSGLRILSPVSQGDTDSINEPVDADVDLDNDNDENGNDVTNQAPNPNPTPNTISSTPADNRPADPSLTLQTLQTALETHIHTLRTEIAALREQLSANHLLSTSTYTLGHHYYSLTPTQRVLHRIKLSIRTYGLLFLRQVLIQLGILALLVAWGRWRGDMGVEMWVRGWVSRVRCWVKRAGRGAAWMFFWVWGLFEGEGALGRLGRILRIV